MSGISTSFINFLHTFPITRWLLSKGYAQGAFWMIMIGVVSVTNDVLMCKLGDDFAVIEVVFFRYLFSMLSVLPFMIQKNKNHFKTDQLSLHFVRALIGAVALAMCCYSVQVLPLAENTAIMFAQPIFFLPMAYFFLSEKVDLNRWIATIIGFLGIIVIAFKIGASDHIAFNSSVFNYNVLIPVSAAILFAVSCVMVKKMIKEENIFTLLFYFGLGTTLFALMGMLILGTLDPSVLKSFGLDLNKFVWKTPTFGQFCYLASLGIGANLIQVCLFRAYNATDASSLTPYQYTEIIFSVLSGYMFFGQKPGIYLFIGAALIISGTFYISYVETRRQKPTKTAS